MPLHHRLLTSAPLSTTIYGVQQLQQTTASAAPQGSLLVDYKGASSYLGLTIWQLRGLVSAGELPIVLVGKKHFFHRKTLAKWAERSEVTR